MKTILEVHIRLKHIFALIPKQHLKYKTWVSNSSKTNNAKNLHHKAKHFS